MILVSSVLKCPSLIRVCLVVMVLNAVAVMTASGRSSALLDALRFDADLVAVRVLSDSTGRGGCDEVRREVLRRPLDSGDMFIGSIEDETSDARSGESDLAGDVASGVCGGIGTLFNGGGVEGRSVLLGPIVSGTRCSFDKLDRTGTVDL